MPEVDKDVCLASFMFFCTNSGNRAKGTVVEKSVSTDNYRGEIPGALMVQLVLQAVITGRVLPYQELSIDCDNMGVVNNGNSPCHPLRENKSRADVMRCFKNLVS